MNRRIIAIVNQKGGTGKTTTAVNLAAGLARGLNNGHRVLLVDMDPQANATRVLVGEKFLQGAQGRSVYEALFAEDHDMNVTDCIHTIDLAASSANNIPVGKLDIMPSHSQMAMAELELVSAFQRESRLRVALASLETDYTFVLIDCPPVLGLLTVNALMAATEVLIPVDPGLFAIDGLGWLQRTIRVVQRGGNSDLRVMGVLPTLTENTVVSRDTVVALGQMFGAGALLPPIPRRTALREAQVHEQDIFAFAPDNAGAQAYKALIREVLKRG